MNKLTRADALRVVVWGLVQGVGFRPWVYRTARALGLTGSVANNPAGVVITLHGRRADRFVRLLRFSPPPLARIAGLSVESIRAARPGSFRIAPSRTGGDPSVAVLPDLAACPDCLAEIADHRDRRFGYPFANCTQCGPRYTIVETLPYDRPNTTMAGFHLCPDCRREYLDPFDRRFHAQPIACPACGPKLTALSRSCRRLPGEPLVLAATVLLEGGVVAIKGLGGFHLACDAGNDLAVATLRRGKGRDSKPLAIMCRNISTVKALCVVGPDESKLLRSAPAPIVLLPRRPEPRLRLSDGVAPANPSLGVMLPYTPLHHLLFAGLECRAGRPVPLVMTSANQSDSPMALTARSALGAAKNAIDLVLAHDRRIANRCDDSVLTAGPQVMIRRARGFVPAPLILPPAFHVKRPVLAVGADLRNAFAVAKGDRLYLGPHIGSVEPGPGQRAFHDALARLLRWTRIRPEVVACDLHPDYWSTRLAETLSKKLGVPLVRVQHHYAHTLSVMAEHESGGSAVGVACDGTGYGTDGAVWGCEILVVRPDYSWERVAHLPYLRHGEGSSELADPARVAGAYLSQVGLKQEAERLQLPRFGLNAVRRLPVETSSLGRLFDAVAAIVGACRRAGFEGEAPIALEAAAGSRFIRPRPAPLDPAPLLRAAVAGVLNGRSRSVVSREFHARVVGALSSAAAVAARRAGTKTVCLSGGVMLNRLLRYALVRRLVSLGLQPRLGREVPVNDGGIAVGQAVAASFTLDSQQRPVARLTSDR